jgi:hypothetical protein
VRGVSTAGRGAARDDGAWRALLAAGVTLAAVGLLFLFPYVARHFRYPVGWDAAFYVWRANAVSVDGLARIGTVRAGSPLLMAALMRATGQNAFTMAAVAPVVLAGVVGLAGGAMVRTALGTRAIWVPVVGVLTWVAFGRVGMMDGHLDNVLNAALVLSGFAAAVGLFAHGRGALAAALLFAAGGLAEWPFYAFAMAVLAVALVLHAWPVVRSRAAGRSESLGAVTPLAWSVAASAAFTGLTFLARPPAGGAGVNIGLASIRALLRRRFLSRLGDAVRYIAFPLGMVGGWIAATVDVPASRRPARRFFVSLMAGWTVVTVAAALAQVAGVPVAGGRLLYYFFVPTILTGVLVWWLARYLAARAPGWTGVAVAAAITAVAVVGFGTLAYRTGQSRVPWIEQSAVRQTVAAGAYVARYAPGRDVVYLIDTAPRHDPSTVGRWWHTVRAALPPDQVARAHRFIGSPSAFLAGPNPPVVRDSATATRLSSTPVAVILQRYDQQGFEQAKAAGRGAEVAPGVLVLQGPAPATPVRALVAPTANARPRSLLVVSVAVVVLLFLAGGGWSMSLVTGDAVLRAALAPGLGVAAIVLTGAAWDRVGFGFHGWEAAGPLIVAAAVGWALAGAAATKRRRAGGGSPEGVRAGWDLAATDPGTQG